MSQGQLFFRTFLASSFPRGRPLAGSTFLADISDPNPALQDNTNTVELERREEDGENPFHCLVACFAPLFKGGPLIASPFLQNSDRRPSEVH